jgi:hypothetical protein
MSKWKNFTHKIIGLVVSFAFTCSTITTASENSTDSDRQFIFLNSSLFSLKYKKSGDLDVSWKALPAGKSIQLSVNTGYVFRRSGFGSKKLAYFHEIPIRQLLADSGKDVVKRMSDSSGGRIPLCRITSSPLGWNYELDWQ